MNKLKTRDSVGMNEIIWRKGDSMIPELKFLILTRRLAINDGNSKKFFKVNYGQLSLFYPENFAIVINDVKRLGNGDIIDARFRIFSESEINSLL